MSPLSALRAEVSVCFPCSAMVASAGGAGETADPIDAGTPSALRFAVGAIELGETSWGSLTRTAVARLVITSGRFTLFTNDERPAGSFGMLIAADSGMIGAAPSTSGRLFRRLEELVSALDVTEGDCLLAPTPCKGRGSGVCIGAATGGELVES